MYKTVDEIMMTVETSSQTNVDIIQALWSFVGKLLEVPSATLQVTITAMNGGCN